MELVFQTQKLGKFYALLLAGARRYDFKSYDFGFCNLLTFTTWKLIDAAEEHPSP